jgi:hypothetical protein
MTRIGLLPHGGGVPRLVVSLVSLASLAVLTGGCDGGADPPTSTSTETSAPGDRATTTGPLGDTTTTGAAEPVPVLDWSALPEPPVPVDGWEVGHCEGDAPLLCVGRPGGRPGVVETLTFAGSSDLDAFTESFLAGVEADREAGCPPGSVVERDAVVDATVGGQPGRRVGFTVTFADGRTVEHGVTWVRAEPDGLRTVGATGFDLEGGSCLEPIGEFAIDDFEAVLGLLDRLVARSEFS